MTVTTTARSVTYLGNDATRVWPFAFGVLEKSDLVITLIVGDVETPLTQAEFSVSALPSTGGSVTYPLVGYLPTGTSIRIRRVVDLKQETQFDNQGGYFAKSIEAGLDRVTMAQQQLQDQIDSFPIAGDVPTTSFSQDFLQSGSALTALGKLGVASFMALMLASASPSAARTALEFPPWSAVACKGAAVENADAIQAVFATQPAVAELAEGVHLVRAGVLSVTSSMRQLRGAGRDRTTVRLADALTTSKQLIKCNNKSNVVISDLTLDGGASQVFMEGVLFTGPATFNVDAGVQLRISMRGDVGSSLAITGAGVVTPPLTWTHATSMFAGEVKSVLVTPTVSGVMTLTKTGTVRQVAVVRNGGGLSSLLNMFNSFNIELRNVRLINFDSLGVVSNGGANIRLTGTTIIDRGADSWEQNVGFLWTWTPGTTARHGHVFIAGTVQVLRTGVQGEGDNIFIADGATIGGTGYGSCVATLVGSGRCHIGNLNYLPNTAYLDQDVTSISYGEHYGWGVLMCPTGSGNPGAPLYICGAMEVISPNIRDSNSYYHALGQDNVPAINFGWLSSTVNSSGAMIRGGGAGDTRSGAARTMGYAIGDTNGNVYGTTVLDFVAYNTITGRYIFNTTPGNNRRFRGLRTTVTVIYDPPSLAPGASGTTQTLTVSGAKVGDRVVGRSFSLSSQGTQIWAEITAANTLSFYFYSPAGNPFGTVNLLSGVCTFEIEESATA